jgi:hypothetical protein
MAVDLPPGYQPSADEEFMNPKQVEYFCQRLEEARTDLRRELDAMPPRDADDLGWEGDQTDHASADSEREFEIQNRERVQMLLRQTEHRLQGSRTGHTATARIPASQYEPYRARDSSRVAEWPAVSSGLRRIRYTWRDISTGSSAVQAPKLRLHGYASDAFRRKFRVFSMRSQRWQAGSSV